MRCDDRPMHEVTTATDIRSDLATRHMGVRTASPSGALAQETRAAPRGKYPLWAKAAATERAGTKEPGPEEPGPEESGAPGERAPVGPGPKTAVAPHRLVGGHRARRSQRSHKRKDGPRRCGARPYFLLRR